MINRNKFASLADALETVDDLDQVVRAVDREKAIRDGMARTGEGRTVVAEFLDAHESMDREAVLSLTDGEPTTLRDALSRYVADLEPRHGDYVMPVTVAEEIQTLLDYPWPAEEEFLASHAGNRSLELEIRYPGGGRVEIYLGGRELISSDYATETVEKAVRETYRAVLARVIGDRAHIVQLNHWETRNLVEWLDSLPRGGSESLGDRLTLDAVENGGILVRTRPYTYESGLAEAQRRMRDTVA